MSVQQLTASMMSQFIRIDCQVVPAHIVILTDSHCFPVNFIASTFYIFAQNEAAFDEVFQHANFSTFVFRNRVKLETYNVSTYLTGYHF